MNKSDMIDIVAGETGCAKDAADRAVTRLFTAIGDGIALGDTVVVKGFGSFDRIAYEGHAGRNPRTGEALEIPPGWRGRFRPGHALKAKLAALKPPFAAQGKAAAE